MAGNGTAVMDGQFPNGFTWGVATAAYQIEGATRAEGRGESIWDRFSHTPGKIVDGSSGDVACDHYHRWREDVALMRRLGVNAYRFSVAWPRVVPAGRGAVNQKGLDFYDRLTEELLEAGITPWITLYHWDLPQPLEDQGGWPRRVTAEAFAAYTDAVTRRLGDRVKHWITLNEPWCSAHLGYEKGEHAPGLRNLALALRASHGLLLGHGLAMEIIRANSRGATAGITLNLAQVYPATDSAADDEAARRLDGYQTRWFLDPLYGRGYPEDMLDLYGANAPEAEPADFRIIAAPTDFLGLNYYHPTFARNEPAAEPLRAASVRVPGEYTQMDWLVEPSGLYDLMMRVRQEYEVGAIYVTENGAAYPDSMPRNGLVEDPERTTYFAKHLRACHHAIADGVPLKGYFAWSLMDNFEWAFGYTRRFGITYVDYQTQARTVKQSGHYYARVVAGNRLVDGDE